MKFIQIIYNQWVQPEATSTREYGLNFLHRLLNSYKQFQLEMNESSKKYSNFPAGSMKKNMFQQVNQITNSQILNISEMSGGSSSHNSEAQIIKGIQSSGPIKIYDTQMVLSTPEKGQKFMANFESKRKQKNRTSQKLIFKFGDSDPEAPEELPYIESRRVQAILEEKESAMQKKPQGKEPFEKIEEMQTENYFVRNQQKPSDYYMEFVMKRNQKGLNKLWNKLDLYSKQTNKYYCSAKMTGYNKDVTFRICQNMSNFIENDTDYLGKVKINFKGNVVNIYGPGYNPVDFSHGKLPIREVFATVQYEFDLFGETKPRSFKVFALKLGISYYEDLQGPVRGKKQIPLNELYKYAVNKQKILVMQNKKPEWSEESKSYILDFGGRAKKASVKNFILQDVAPPNTIRALLGKIDDDEFRLDVSGALTPLVGFGIALSAFGGKFGTI